jgi:hypothetical protein
MLPSLQRAAGKDKVVLRKAITGADFFYNRFSPFLIQARRSGVNFNVVAIFGLCSIVLIDACR